MDEGGTSGSQRRVDLLEELRLGLSVVGSSRASSSTAGSSQAPGSADPSAALAAQLQEEEDAKARGAKRVAAKLARARFHKNNPQPGDDLVIAQYLQLVWEEEVLAQEILAQARRKPGAQDFLGFSGGGGLLGGTQPVVPCDGRGAADAALK